LIYNFLSNHNLSGGGEHKFAPTLIEIWLNEQFSPGAKKTFSSKST